MSKVALVPCSNYEDDVYGKVCSAIALLGGIRNFVNSSEKILVKPNVLTGVAPEKATTTHPAVFEAVLNLLREEGCENIFYGDNPGNPMSDVENSMSQAGLSQAADKYNVPLGDFDHAVTTSYPEGKVCKKFEICKAASDADAIISVCKMKTHALENITGAVKNQYGLIYSANKALGHALYPNSRKFAEMLADLDMMLKPRLYIMDGVIAMEGNGPASGDPVPMKVILASADPVALDTVFAGLINLDPACVPTCVCGAKAGLGTMNKEKIEILTPDGPLSFSEAAEKHGKPDFDVKRENAVFWRLSAFSPFRKKKKDRPVVDLSKCTGCGICMKACPVDGKAVHSGNGKKAEYDYKKCIRCYCCQEMCPSKAISTVNHRN